MSDSEYSESLDVNGQDESEGNEQRIHLQMQQLQQHHHQMLQQQLLQQQQHHQQQQQQTGNVNFMEYAGSTSSSGDSSISSSSSDDSDDNETEDTLELAKITNEVLSLPRGLCENAAVFQEFFSLETWHELPIPVQNHLQQFLPRFHGLPPQMEAIEQTRTLSMLFNNELTRFGQSPLTTLQQQLEVGNCRPDIIKLRQNILKSRRREQRFQHCEQLSQVAKQLFLSRQRLLETAYKSSPDTIIKYTPHATHQPKPAHLYRDNKLSAMRARKRFYSEISNIAQQLGIKDEDFALSADEEDDDCLVAEEFKKENLLQQKSLDDLLEPVKPATSLADRCIYSTVFKKQQDIEDEEAFRLQQKSKQSKLTNRNFKEYLRDHKRRKLTEPALPEFETSDIRLRDVCARAQMGGNFKRIFAMGKTPGRKPKTIPPTPPILTTSAAAATAFTPMPLTTNAINTNSTLTTATTTQPITLATLPPPAPPAPAPAPPQPQLPQKLSEPPALVPIQQPIKKPETYQVVTKTTANMAATLKKSQPQFQQHSTLSSLTLERQHHKLQHHLHHHNNSNDTSLHLNPVLNVSNHSTNLNLCMDDSSLLAGGEHDAFNMLDNEVELQQEEVETFGGTCEETIPAFVIANDVINDTNSLLTTTATTATRNQQLNSGIVSQQPLPKLEPLSRIGDTKSSIGKSLLTPKMSNTSTPASELIQETHACYFSLIRDFFCATPNHRMRYDDLRNKIDVWLRNPITALNEWYSLAENWSNLLRSAINFLVGEFPDLPEEYVPYIEHKIQINIYQWIGAGRDSDTRLSELCGVWMEKRKQPNDLYKSASSAPQAELKLEICPRNSSSIENDDSPEGGSDKDGGLSPPPPPPRFPTTWTVRAATMDEISEFQRQERDRFEQPHKAYTYRMHGYESVVGPVKGIYTPLLALSKARGHSMMVGDRPNFVTILTLVRDATARLPNGEGTRADISELLKCSQYINQDAAENVLQTIVSGALDRMHTEHDPCVRYDPKRKIWIYLHRNRSEEEFERIHQQNQCIGKTKKLPQRKPRPVCGSNKSNSIDQDHFNILTPSDTSSNINISNNNSNGTLISMPALVPSKPIIVTNQLQRQQHVLQQQQQQQQQQINMNNKCPPVPPLKYNIPTHSGQTNTGNSQQQKSLLKTTIRTENKTPLSSSSPAAATTNVTKQYSFQMPQAKNNPNQNTTPIIVATPQGLQTVHVSNATSVMPTANQQQQQQQQQHNLPTQQQQTNLTAQLAGKRVTLNKPIIINQVTQQTSNTSSSSGSSSPSQQQQKLKSPQQIIQKTQLIQNQRINLQNQQQQQIISQQQQQQSNIIIPLSMAKTMNLNINSSDQTLTSSSSSHQQQQSSSSLQSPKQNIIRLVPASNVKSLMNSSTTTQIVSRQRILTSSSVERPNTPQQQQLKTNSGIQLLSNSGNIITVNSGNIIGSGGGVGAAGTITNPAGSIVKMTPQQFVSLQQKQAQQLQQQQQQHIIVKQSNVAKGQTAVGGSKPQRVILGNTSVMTQSGQGKNIVLQQIPVASSASSSLVVTPSYTTTSSSPTTALSGNKIQTINTTNLTPQQQRILIQNLKQQQQHQQQHQTINQNQIQFKTVQVVGNTAGTQQQHSGGIVGRPQTITMATNQQQQPKTVVVVSQDNGTQQQQQQITRILKASPQLKSDGTMAGTTTAGTRVITSSTGQIISLDSLIQKQGGTLRIAGSGGNTTQTIKTNQQQQQHITNIIHKSQLQQQQQQQQQKQQHQTQQYAIVSVPNSIISLGNNSNFTVGQRIITTQAGSSAASTPNTTSLVNIGSTRATTTAGVSASSGTGRVITATPAGTKIITKPTTASAGNIRVINSVNQTGNINLATLQGKQVVLATGKTMNTINKVQLQTQQHPQQHNIVQTQGGSIVIGGQTVKLQQGNTNIQQLLQKSGNIITTQNTSANQSVGTPQMQTVIMGNQILRVQQMPQIVTTTNRLNVAANSSKTISSNSDNSITTVNSSNMPKTLYVGTSGQTLRLQTASASSSPSSSSSQTITNKNIILQSSSQQNNSSIKTANTTTNAGTTTPNRVVLAVQGGGQIFLSPNFQGGNINLKSLQNMKVVSLAQHQQQQQSSLTKDSLSSNTITTSSPSSLTSQTTILKKSSTPTAASDTNV